MFDSGGSSGAAARRARRPAAGRHPQVRARAGAQRARGAARAARASADARARTPRRPHRRQPAALDDAALQRRFPRRRSTACARCSGARGACGRSSVQQASVCAEYGDGSDHARRSRKWTRDSRPGGSCSASGWSRRFRSTRPSPAAIGQFDAVIIGPGSFYTSLMPIFLVRGVAEALQNMKGPIILIANLLTEGRGMVGIHCGRRGRPHRGVDPSPGRRRHHEREVAAVEGPRTVCARTQGAADARRAARSLRAGRRGVLDRRHRPPRSTRGSPMRCGASCRGGCSVTGNDVQRGRRVAEASQGLPFWKLESSSFPDVSQRSPSIVA